MRISISIILVATWGLAVGQSTTDYKPRFESCADAIKQARVDADSGILRSISHGFRVSTRPYEFKRFYEHYMIAKYGVEIYDAGCIIMEHEECYTDAMHKIITDKFGSNFLKRTDEEAKNEFEIFKTFGQEEKKQYIDFDYTYRITDTRASYSKGYKELGKEIRRRIDFTTVDFSPYPDKGVGVFLLIGQTGKIEKCEVVSKGFPREIGERIEREIMDIGDWSPATLYGHAVRSETMLTLMLMD